jgi:DNA-binding XRE family transcriptional regulator
VIFSNNVQKLKNEAGFTDLELATYIGVSRSTVKRILSHRRGPNTSYTPTYRTVRAVADKLKLSTDDVYKYHVEFHTI